MAYTCDGNAVVTGVIEEDAVIPTTQAEAGFRLVL